MDLNGNRDRLRFPPFYPELIRGRNLWSISENIGRIKIIIAEGFCQVQSEPVFHRVKNVVCFNFQHAPLGKSAMHVRVCSGVLADSVVVWERFQVAWPNPGMWFRPRHPAHVAPPVAVRKRSRTGPEVDAHSPRDRVVSRRSTVSACTTIDPIVLDLSRARPLPAMPDRPLARTPDWNTPMNLPDPFIDNTVGQGQPSFCRRSGSVDRLMLDYSRSTTPSYDPESGRIIQRNRKALSSTAPTSHEQSGMTTNAISVRKDGTSGTFAQGTDGSHSNSTTNAPTVVSKLSAAAEAWVAPRGPRHGGQTSWKGRTKSANRKVSDVSMKSLLSEDVGGSEDTVDDNINVQPAGSIKGKRGGRGNDPEAKQPEISTKPRAPAKKENARSAINTRATVSEGKRKRDSTVSENEVADKGGDVRSSPTKQVLRKASQGGRSAVIVHDLTGDESPAKAPLQVRTNVQ